MSSDRLARILSITREHEQWIGESFSLIPSENVLSSLARDMLVGDLYSRYYFEEDRGSSAWAFPAGRAVGELLDEVLVPRLREFARAQFIDLKSNSGISNMIVAMAAHCDPGDTLLCLPAALGGHASTATVARRLGLEVFEIPHLGVDVDEAGLAELCRRTAVRLVYIDQSHVLFPVETDRLRFILNDIGSSAAIHVDSSHCNALIFGGVHPNPLESGADSFGGSFHKTFPGPHKAFIATNSPELAKGIKAQSAHLISHGHAGELVALAIVLEQFAQAVPSVYASRIVANARAFAGRLAEGGLSVAAADRGFTDTHQVWVGASDAFVLPGASQRLFQAGILVNTFGGLPGISQGGVRLGLNEATAIGLHPAEARDLATLFVDAARGATGPNLKARVAELRRRCVSPFASESGVFLEPV
jgi:glycine hydroxymethyltransferase